MPCLRVGNSYFHLHTKLNRNGGNLLNNIWGAKQVDNTLVDTKFKSIPSVGTYKPETKRIHNNILQGNEQHKNIFHNRYISNKT